MSAIKRFKQRTIAIHVVTALAIMSATAHADQAVDLGQVSTTGTYSGKMDKDSASYNAPSQTNLEATEPQSIINQHYIQENAAAGANYTDIISITPSVTDIAPNGSGLMESGGGGGTPTIRGFQDGQYNVTFDGIPWGDSNDFTHHSTVYFMPQDMGQIVVDRGPGDASTIGNATYGGTIAITSKAPSSKQETNGFGSVGSWNTRLLGTQYDSGLNNDTRFYLSYKNLNSDGFLTNSPQSRNNAFLKYEKAASENTTITAVAMYNHTMQHVPNMGSQALYGYNFGNTTNGQSEANSAYNYDDLTTDFEYLGIKSKLGKWTIDNKLYTYAYYHNGGYGLNYGSVTAANTVADGGTSNGPSNVPGTMMHNNYRSIGDVLRATYELGTDKIEVGGWFDRQTDNRFEQQVDWTLNGAPNNIFTTTTNVYGKSYTSAQAAATQGSVDRNQQSDLNTFQGFAQYIWKVTPSWEITPGLKYDSFMRTMNAVVNQGTMLPYVGSETWDKTLKSINTRYAINKNLSAYAQYSEGFLAPNMNVFYKTGVNLASVAPTTTKNYQVGTNWSSKDMTFGVDFYRIDANNIAFNSACPAGYSNCATLTPTVTYSGFELEGTYKLTKALALYANFAHNGYNVPSGAALQPYMAETNAAAGLIYQNGGLYSSITAKYLGQYYSGNADASGNNIFLGGYTIANFNMSYKFDGGYKAGLAVNNLFNTTGNMASPASDVNSNPLYFVIPTRSYQVNFSVPF